MPAILGFNLFFYLNCVFLLKTFREMKFLSIGIIFGLLIASSYQDIYLHNMRGSNNRLNEKSAARTNGNRVFDSQVRIIFFPRFSACFIEGLYSCDCQ